MENEQKGCGSFGTRTQDVHDTSRDTCRELVLKDYKKVVLSPGVTTLCEGARAMCSRIFKDSNSQIF